MLSSSNHNATNAKDFLLQLDNETDDRKSIASIDTAHQFLNFSRKVTEASSMRRPVDIQLGIACGKDLLFNSPSRILRRQQQPPLAYTNKTSLPTKALQPTPLPPTSPPLLVRNNSKKSNHSKETIKLPLSPITPLRPIYSLSINNNDTTIPNNHRPSPLSPQPQSQKTHNKPTTTHPSSSPLLDRLVADVLNHIESCPDQSAYSDDLDRLKPKLQAYSVTRHSSLKTNS